MTVRSAGAPTGDVVTVAELKRHVRVDGDHDDSDLAAYLETAIALVEADTQRRLREETLEWVLPAWRPALRFPLAPIGSVASVTYVDETGAAQTLDPARYLLAPDGETHVLRPRGEGWPALGADAAEPIVIRFVAGPYVNPRIKQAVKFLAAHLYENREPVNVGNIVTPIPFTVDSLLAAERWT